MPSGCGRGWWPMNRVWRWLPEGSTGEAMSGARRWERIHSRSGVSAAHDAGCTRRSRMNSLPQGIATLWERVEGLAGHQHPNRFQAQRCFVEHGQALLALLAQGDEFAVAYRWVDGLQRGQTCQLFFGIGSQTTLCFGHAFGVFRRDPGFTGVDLRVEHVTLGLDELVGA